MDDARTFSYLQKCEFMVRYMNIQTNRQTDIQTRLPYYPSNVWLIQACSNKSGSSYINNFAHLEPPANIRQYNPPSRRPPPPDYWLITGLMTIMVRAQLSC